VLPSVELLQYVGNILLFIHIVQHSKEDFVWILGNLFLATGWLTIGIHYVHSVSIAAPLTHLRSMFYFDWSQNPVIIWKCDM